LDGFKPLADAMVRVNQPLDIHHIRFYQASWGVTGMVRQAVLKIGDRTVPLTMKQSFPIPGQPWTGRIEAYLPNFTIGANGEPTTANLEWKNPALLIGIYSKEQKIATLALQAPSPTGPIEDEPWAMFFIQGGHVSTRPPFKLVSAQPMLFSGIQVNYDPGFPIVVAGVLSMLAGLLALFYLHQRRVMVFMAPDADGVRMDVGAWSSRGAQEFQSEFKKLFVDWPLAAVKPSEGA